MMANKRSSSRLDRKRDMEEQAFMKRMEEEIRLEMERSTEEAKRKQRDLDALMANRKRIIGDSIEQREEETEESIQTYTRNPTMRKFQRLSSME